MRFQLASDGIKISRRKKSNDEITDIWRIWSRWPGMRRVVETVERPFIATAIHNVPTG
jgi:hypothetical protein